MSRVLATAGARPTACIVGQVPPRYAFLAGAADLIGWSEEAAGTFAAQCDGILIVDTCSWAQLGPAAEFVRNSLLPRVVVDHHATFDNLSGPADPAVVLRDPTSASCCGLLWEWCRVMDWPVDRSAAEALLAGLMTDTGWLRFSNSDGRAFRQAAELVDRGPRCDVLYVRLYESWSPARLRLKALMLATLRFHLNKRVATMHLTPEMFAEAQAAATDAEELVQEALQAAPVVVAVLLNVMADGVVRVNLRSKSPEVCGVDVDVSAIAGAMGGGGHRRAAGARLTEPLESAHRRIMEALERTLDG